MALDLFCYCSQSPTIAEPIRSRAAKTLEDDFGDGLIVYEVKEANVVHREIAGELGLQAASRFLVSINDKAALATRVMDIVKILKLFFGDENIIVLLNNESLMI